MQVWEHSSAHVEVNCKCRQEVQLSLQAWFSVQVSLRVQLYLGLWVLDVGFVGLPGTHVMGYSAGVQVWVSEPMRVRSMHVWVTGVSEHL